MVQRAVPGAPLTIEAWAELDEDVSGELVDGRLEEEEVPTALHGAIAAWLLWALQTWVMPREGRAFGSELKLAVGRGRGRKADVSVYLQGRALPGRHRGATARPPSIVVEVLSPAPRDVRRDVVDKKREYAAFGVQAYWLVDPRARTLEVLELAPDGRYIVALSASEGAHGIPSCEGLTLDLDALWAHGESLPDDE